MDRPRKVAVATASRAERGILEPVISRLAARDDVVLQVIEQRWDRLLWDYYFQDWMTNGTRPAVMLVPADRKEMVDLAMRAYYSKIPVFHLWAGVGGTGTWDDLNRRVISSFAYLMLCEDAESRLRLIMNGEEPWRCVVTGTPHYDDLKVDEAKVPSEPYDLVLIKPNPVDRADEEESWKKVFEMADKHVVEIGPGEGGQPTMHTSLGIQMEGRLVDYYSNLPRPEFLGLLKNCRRFITNSSSAAYEAPYFGIKVVNPSRRNSARVTHAEPKPGAADRIAELLATFPIDRAKLLKVYD